MGIKVFLSGDLGLFEIWIVYLNLLHGDLGDYFYVWNENLKNFISSNKFFGSLVSIFLEFLTLKSKLQKGYNQQMEENLKI